MRKPVQVFCVLTVMAVLLGNIHANAQDAVGQVVAVKGEVSAMGVDGITRELLKSAPVFVGDNIVTADGAYAVIQFVDGAKATMRPDSSLSVDKYAFGTGADGAVLSLVKGGLRAITGEIANERPDSYTVETNVATLGVRGTEFAIRICEQDCAQQENEGLD